MLKKLNTTWFRVLVTLLSLGFVAYAIQGKFLEALEELKSIDPAPVACAILLNFVSLVPVSWRLDRIMRVQGIHIPFKRVYYLWTISLFFNLFMPSAVGGDVLKAYYLAKDSGKKMASVTSVLFDRFFGLMATITIGAISFLIAREHISDPKIGHILFWFVVGLGIGILFIMSRRFSHPMRLLILKLFPKGFHERLKSLFAILDLYRVRRIEFFISLGLSVMAQVVFIVLTYLLAMSLGLHLSPALFFLFLPIIAICSMIPSIGGLGVREGATIYLFGPYMSPHEAAALAILIDFFTYGIGIACGILYAIQGGASMKEIEKMETQV